MTSFHDDEFGEVIIRHNAWVNGYKISVDTSGRLVITVRPKTPTFLAKRFIGHSREKIREILPVKDPSTQRARDMQKKLLTKKARDYLPYRLEFWAQKYGYS